MLRFFLIILFLPALAFSSSKIVNVYAWTSEIPDFIIRQFEAETGITVNFSTYENNEVMYAKLRAAKKTAYDVIMPSSYFVDRMRRQNMLQALDKNKLPNWKNLNPEFLHAPYDPGAKYSAPYIWGVTGIFYNQDYYPQLMVKKWSDLWSTNFYNQLMILDDMREAFAMALLSLGYSVNEQDKAHIKQAFTQLKLLTKNIKVFSTETVVSIMIDEDATAGMSWNGDAFKSARENSNIKFIFPEDGFVIWVDSFAIPRKAPHLTEAYQFINFMLRPDIAKLVALYTDFPIANLAGQKLLPDPIRNNPIIYPAGSILKHGQFQVDLSDETLALYEKYWEELKMSG